MKIRIPRIMNKLAKIINGTSLISDIRTEEIPAFLSHLAAVQAAFTARLLSEPQGKNGNGSGHLLNVDQVAAILNLPKSKIYELARQKNGLPFIQLGKYKRIAPADLRNWLENEGANLLDSEINQWQDTKYDGDGVQKRKNTDEGDTSGTHGTVGPPSSNNFKI